jgi:hypothetical protein
MKKHITLFEQFVREEGSNIYEAQEMALDTVKLEDTDLKLKKEAYKTWINDYVIPMMDFGYDEKNPEFKTLISSAKSWLSKDSGIESTDALTKKTLKWTNGEIVYYLYWEKNFAKAEKSRFPLLSSVYDLVKGKTA